MHTWSENVVLQIFCVFLNSRNCTCRSVILSIQMSNINSLPEVVFSSAIAVPFLDIPSFLSLASVCRQFRCALKHESVWRGLQRRDFAVLPSADVMSILRMHVEQIRSATSLENHAGDWLVKQAELLCAIFDVIDEGANAPISESRVLDWLCSHWVQRLVCARARVRNRSFVTQKRPWQRCHGGTRRATSPNQSTLDRGAVRNQTDVGCSCVLADLSILSRELVVQPTTHKPSTQPLASEEHRVDVGLLEAESKDLEPEVHQGVLEAKADLDRHIRQTKHDFLRQFWADDDKRAMLRRIIWSSAASFGDIMESTTYAAAEAIRRVLSQDGHDNDSPNAVWPRIAGCHEVDFMTYWQHKQDIRSRFRNFKPNRVVILTGPIAQV